jgi:hypothetical protein
MHGLPVSLGVMRRRQNMNSTDETIIELSKKKIVLLILGACAFVALGVWLFSLDDSFIQSQRRFNNPTFIHGIGILSIVFFGLCGITALKKLFNKKPGLVLNNIGVLDNSSGVSAGLIPWSEVVGSEIFEINNQKMLIIKIRNPQKYIEGRGLLKQMLNKANYKMCGSPIAISSNALKIKFPELLSLFDQYQKKYGNA